MKLRSARNANERGAACRRDNQQAKPERNRPSCDVKDTGKDAPMGKSHFTKQGGGRVS